MRRLILINTENLSYIISCLLLLLLVAFLSRFCTSSMCWVVITIIMGMIFWWRIVWGGKEIIIRTFCFRLWSNRGSKLSLTPSLPLWITNRLFLNFKKRKHFSIALRMRFSRRRRRKRWVEWWWISHTINLRREQKIVTRISHQKANLKIILRHLLLVINLRRLLLCLNLQMLILNPPKAIWLRLRHRINSRWVLKR